jgi:hypothetical protein
MGSQSVCTRCVLPGSTPGIEFDSSGICNYCNTYAPVKVLGEQKLRESLDAFRGTGREYDCLVLISGGRDSTYTLSKLVNDYEMRVLAANYMNPFASEQARANMRNALNILGTDCVSWEYPNDIHRKATRKALEAWAHRPSSIMIPIVCTYCKTYLPRFFQIAMDNDVSLIVIGSNPFETASFKSAGFGGSRTYHRFSNLPKIASRSLKELLLNPRYLVCCSWSMIGKMYLMAGHTSPYLRWKYGDITVLRLFDYIEWNEREVMTTIADHLGWQKSSEVASPWRFDCRLDYVRRLMYEMTIGVSELRDLFSKMIREGQMTREGALKRLETEDVVPEDVVKDVLANLGLRRFDLHLD